MRVAMVTGSCPPDTCGIGDYTATLARELRARTVEVEIITGDQWSARNSICLKKQIQLVNTDIVHLQYPTVGYGMGLAPQALSLLMPLVVTIHEVSQAHILRRLSLFPFSLRSRRIVFTTGFEQSYARRFAPWICGRSSVIPVGASIPTANQAQERTISDIVYFGLFRPKKGIEDVIHLAELIQREKLPYSIRMIGTWDVRQMDYYEYLRTRSKDLPIVWDVDLPAARVSELLGQCSIAYMPFPDGVSERRTSLLALMTNGIAVVTTRGSFTTSEIDGAVEFAPSPEDALKVIHQLYIEPDYRNELSSRASQYASHFSWHSIACKHIELYRDISIEST